MKVILGHPSYNEHASEGLRLNGRRKLVYSKDKQSNMKEKWGEPDHGDTHQTMLKPASDVF